MKGTTRNILLFALTLLLVLAALLGSSVYGYRFSKATVGDGVLYIHKGAEYEAVADSLASLKVLKNIEKFNRYANQRGLGMHFHTGRYEIKKGMTYAQLISRIRGGMQSPIRVTFNNIRTLDQFAGVIADMIDPDSVSMYRYFTADSVQLKYGMNSQTMISLFIPNTYELYWNVTPEQFTERMKREYDNFWNANREEKLKKIGLSRIEAITLASIVYEETKMSDEMPRVAGVYLNRLKIKMPLQADPTIKFAAGDFTIKRVLNRHKEVDSPYNTYKYTGLPPGPICMPSIKAIDAVLDPEDHSYLYFCASPDFSGYHKFAKSHDEHVRNAQEYQRELNARGIFK